MKHQLKFTLLLFFLFVEILSQPNNFPVPQIEFSPETYICYRTIDSINIDGCLIEESWQEANWTKYFVDIEGLEKPAPDYKTRLKMLWDNDYIYFGAELEEPDLWATLTKRDTVIFYDNDFEIFIDPDGDTHNYYEFEINALNTYWDLFLIKPYRDGEKVALNLWDIPGLKTNVKLFGTLNEPSDSDSGWTVEIAIPLRTFKESSKTTIPPENGDQWRVNFSRVEWDFVVADTNYLKAINPETGRPFPEKNWVWSPQGLINMHYPEMWGFVQFTDSLAGNNQVEFKVSRIEEAKWILRQLYYAQREYFLNHSKYTNNISDLIHRDINTEEYLWPPEIEATNDFFKITMLNKGQDLEFSIRHDGLIKIQDISDE
ncbi:carbohydrate-binding family 9-like protein [Bacteroidota bacterium]